MKYVCIAIASSCIGNLIGSQYQMPQWIMWALLVLGTTMWCIAKWIDRSKGKSCLIKTSHVPSVRHIKVRKSTI